jgi:hypothetical protein
MLVRTRRRTCWLLLGSALGCGGCGCSEEQAEDQAAPPAGGARVVLSVGNSEARSCDVVLEERGGARVVGAAFSDSSIGEFQQRSPRLAIAFIARQDGAFESNVVSFEVNNVGGQEPVAVGTATCYDRRGRALGDARLALRRER